MKKITAKILLIVMIFNTILANITFNVFAVNKPKETSKTNFTWNKQGTLNDNLELIERPQGSDEILLTWDIESLGGTPNDNGTYSLSYPIADDKEIKFEIKRKSNKSQITYKVNDDNSVNKSNKTFTIYKEGAYLPANNTNFPPTETFKLDSTYGSGEASKVSFEIGENGGASFKYMGNTIKFLWKNDKMYFVTNSVSRGNIYPFELSYTRDVETGKEKKDIFLGIDTVNGFSVKPFANADETNYQNGKDIIEQVKRPINEYPGSEIVGVTIKFNSPKEWDSNKKKYEFITTEVENEGNKATEVIFNLGHSDPSKKVQVNIQNIYANDGIVVGPTGNAEGKYEYDSSTHQGTLTLKKLQHSTIFSDISISVERRKAPFETMESVLPIGTVYTYPKFKMIALGESEFYLEIEPYEGYNGYYVVQQGLQVGTISKWATYEEKNQGKDKIIISVPLDATAPQEKYFRVDFSFTPPDLESSSLPFTSQILKYKPHLQDIVLATPKNLKVVSSNIIKKDEEPENLFLTLKWDIDSESVLAGIMKNHTKGEFNIDYLFYKGFKPNEIEEKDFLGVNLAFRNKEEGSIKDGIVYSLKEEYTNLGIEIVEDKTFTSNREEILGNKKKNILEANVTFKIPVTHKDANDTGVLQYPNTYFLASKGEYTVKSETGEDKHTTGLSLPVTLTLNGIQKIEVPAPQNLKVLEETVAEKKFSVEYDNLKYKEEKDLLYLYNEIMLKTIGRELKEDSIKYDFYITQNKKLFDELVKYSKDSEIPDNIKSKINIYENNQSMTGDGITVDLKNNTGNQGNLLDSLRNNGTVQISNIGQDLEIGKQKINFDGLDENETYYVVGRTNITPYEESNHLDTKKDFSKFSILVTATTQKDDSEPSENEKVPPAPIKFIAKDITLNSVNLIWNKVKDNLPEGQDPKSKLEYQFIKTRGEQLPDSFLKSKDSYTKTWESLSNIKDKEGLKTDNDKLYEFDKESKQFSTTEASKDRYEYINYDGEEGNIQDKTLIPNQIYFYYIRTVRVSENGDEAYSVWVPLTFTTKNTTGPTNLRVERKAEYNKKSEVVISFDIPKMDKELIGTEYDLQYSIKEDLGNWSEDTTMPKDKLTFKDNDDGKTMKVTYKITGLKSGTMYTIRVRMLNIPLNAPSIYSNEVEHKTDADNADNDYDQDVDNWLNNFKDQIEDLKNQPYWYGKDTSSNTLVYYRPQYFDKIIATTNNSIIDLVVGKGGSYKEYYLPASAIIKAFDQNKGFKISYNGADVIFTSKFLSPYDNDVIKKITEQMQSKNGNIKDYFVKLSIDFKNTKYIINGSDSLSPSALISVSIVGTKKTIADWDSEMLSYIDKLLKTEEFSKDVEKRIKQLIKDKTDNKIMIQEISKMVDNFKDKFGNELSKDINNLSRKTEHIQYLTGDIIYAYTLSTDISVSGYKKGAQASWISIEAKDYLGKKAIYTKETGEYIFAGKKLVINGAGNLPNGNQMTNIVIKYGLDDFLGKDGNINLKASMTKRQTIGSLARLAGASRTQDPIEFFKTKGIILSTRNMDNNITSEEAVYLTMKVYELRSGTKIETVKIRNYNLTKDIKNINKNYKKPIQVAFETGIYKNPNMNPKGTISVQEFLQSLVNMSTMVGI